MQIAMTCRWVCSIEEHEQLSSPWGQVHSNHRCCPHTLCWVRSLQGIQPHTTELLSSLSRAKWTLPWKMVFYDNHAASAKQINLFHAFYPHCRQLQERGTCYWKARFTDTVREQSDITYIFWNNGLFPTTALAFVPFALAPSSWLGSDIIPLSSRRKQSLESGCLGA